MEKLWKDKELVDKRILPENQRCTIVSLTEKGKQIIEFNPSDTVISP